MINTGMVQRRFHEWARPGIELTPGYTVLIPVPGDLPVFLKIALEVCAAQEDEHRLETLIVPDQLTPGFPDLLAEWAREYSMTSVRLVKIKTIDRAIISYFNHPHINHWLQLTRGIEEVRTRLVLLHDADLF